MGLRGGGTIYNNGCQPFCLPACCFLPLSLDKSIREQSTDPQYMGMSTLQTVPGAGALGLTGGE
jgi:hypothetical protein